MLRLEDIMTKEELSNYLIKALTYRSRTSYKFYFLLSLIKTSEKRDTISLEECGINMMAISWNDLSESNFKYPELDKLKRYKVDLMKHFDLAEITTEKELKKLLLDSDDKLVKNIAYDLTQYCPYLFLSIGQWDKRLRGIVNYHERHRLIQEFSQQESCFYEIYEDKVVLNSEYFDIIRNNSSYFIELVRCELKRYLMR